MTLLERCEQALANSTTVARCRQHGLHGARTDCFECGRPVEQVEFVPAALLRDCISALRSQREALDEIGEWPWALYAEQLRLVLQSKRLNEVQSYLAQTLVGAFERLAVILAIAAAALSGEQEGPTETEVEG